MVRNYDSKTHGVKIRLVQRDGEWHCMNYHFASSLALMYSSRNLCRMISRGDVGRPEFDLTRSLTYAAKGV